MKLESALAEQGIHVVKHVPSWIDRIVMLTALAIAIGYFVTLSSQQRALLANQIEFMRRVDLTQNNLDRADADRLEALRLLHNSVLQQKEK